MPSGQRLRDIWESLRDYLATASLGVRSQLVDDETTHLMNADGDTRPLGTLEEPLGLPFDMLGLVDLPVALTIDCSCPLLSLSSVLLLLCDLYYEDCSP